LGEDKIKAMTYSKTLTG